MKTWLTIGVCLMATFLASDRSFVSGADLQGFEAEEEMSLRAFPDDNDEEDYDYDGEYAEEEEEEEEEESGDGAAERKRRAYGGGNGNFGQPSNLRPIITGPNPPGIARPGFPPIQPGFPQPGIGNPNPGFPQPGIGIPNPGFPQPGIGGHNPGYPQPPNNRIPGYPHPPIGGGRPVVGKRCTGVSRTSPHWVPGLDSWCPQNCPTGNCPSYLCTCY